MSKPFSNGGIAFRLPDPASPDLVAVLSPWHRPRLSAGNVVLSRAPGSRHQFVVPMTDGREERVRLRNSADWSLFAEFHDSKIPLLPKLKVWQIVLMLLPLGLVGIGGALGGMIGAGGMLVNQGIMRGSLTSGLKAGAALAVAVGAFIAYLALAAFIFSVLG